MDSSKRNFISFTEPIYIKTKKITLRRIEFILRGKSTITYDKVTRLVAE